jgi:urocanate hydratase
MGGVSRRAWARNPNAIETTMKFNQTRKDSDHITLPFIADDEMVKKLVTRAFRESQTKK